ncbi:MAG: hypothetical protein M3Q65_18810, partial [Chloroflexota bacterium]|nr:hypothetical protein [Chloroflexota bacterium]
RGLGNVTLVAGDITHSIAMEQLPDDHFDLALSQRGPNLNEPLARKLRNDAFFLQELVSEFDGFPVKEIFGRYPYVPGAFAGHQGLLSAYAELGFFPVSVKEYFYEEFFRDSEHLAVFLRQGAMLSNWRLPPKPYDAGRDHGALELYVRYNTTPKGIRLLRQRKVFALRRARVHYYPADWGPE